MNTHNEPVLAWQAPVRVSHQRSEKWYLVGGLFCATAVAYGVVTGEWSLSVVFGMIAGLYFLTRNETHRDHRIAIYETGVQFDDAFRPWSQCREFWMFSGPGYYELHIESTKYFRPELVILTGDADPFLIRDTISSYIPQNPNRKEKLLDTFIRFCKL